MTLQAGYILAAMLAGFAVLHWLVRAPLPLTLILIAAGGAALGGFGVPFRHLVEGGFGYLNLVMALFAGAFFGHAMRQSGATEVLARAVIARDKRWLPLIVAGALLFVTGMVTGIAGIAVLSAGVFAEPLLRHAGLSAPRAAGYIAVMATLGMIAPPLNVPAMIMADGVNMPYAGFAPSMFALSLPPALFALFWFRRAADRDTDVVTLYAPGPATGAGWLGVALLVLIIAFWIVIRYWPALLFDPSVPLVLVAGGLIAMAAAPRAAWGGIGASVFAGTPLVLAAVLVAVGVLVQIMALTGVRGFIVINAMSAHPPLLYVALAAMPALGSVLTALGAANSLGVPFAFAFIAQDMILNISALSAIAALSEFCPPTAIATALAAYVVGETRLWPAIRSALPTLALLTVLAVLMLVLAPVLAPYLR